MKLLKQPIIGKQTRNPSVPYRLMHYVVTQEVEEGMLLFNTLTCSMALVTHEEAKDLAAVEELVENWFLVPVGHDDKKLCKMVRAALMYQRKRPKGLKEYTIITTTGCNARCAYCFEQGVQPVHMTMETAEKVAQFIIGHQGEQEKVKIEWFGGEPLYNMKVMDRISTILKEHDIKFSSHITSNGYLFSDNMIKKAVELWNVKKVQITLDGTEENYNRIKAYVNAGAGSPFQRVLDNIQKLLETNDIKVSIRINLENDVLDDIWTLTRQLAERFKGYKNLTVYYSPLFEHIGPQASVRTPEQRRLIMNEIRKMRQYLRSIGMGTNVRKKLMGGLLFNQCKVDSGEGIMIAPDGHLGLCEHYVDSHFFGHIDSEEWDEEAIKQMREYWEEIPECDTCACYPMCFRLKICNTLGTCYEEVREDNVKSIQEQMMDEYKALLEE